MDVAQDVFHVVVKQPLGAVIRIANAVGVTEDFVVVLGFVAVGIADVSQADFFTAHDRPKRRNIIRGCTPKSPKFS